MINVTLWFSVGNDSMVESKQYRCTEVDIFGKKLHLNFSNGRMVIPLHAIDSFTAYASVFPKEEANIFLDGKASPVVDAEEEEDALPDWLDVIAEEWEEDSAN